jgi:xanthine/CO dehydrogenase XdhC/CoxF family maturation factor
VSSEQEPEPEPEQGLVVVVSDNPIARSLVAIAEIAGRRTTLLPDQATAPSPLQWLSDHPLTEADALVLCDHDAPEADALLRCGLEGSAGYVAMMGSRRRAEHVFTSLENDLPPEVLDRLRVPAGLNTGGKAPGEIALSVVAEIVAVSYGRDGGPMRRPR